MNLVLVSAIQGGRGLSTKAVGETVTSAPEKAYQLLNQVSWENVMYRTDIAYRAIEREKT